MEFIRTSSGILRDRATVEGRRFRACRASIDAIEGLLVPGQERWLFQQAHRLPDGSVIVEVGSYKGRSTACLGFACVATEKRVLAIDTFDGNDCDFSGPGRRGFFAEWEANIRRCGLSEYVTPLVGTSRSIASTWTGRIGFLFIDGSHVYSEALSDFDMFYPFVADGGLLAMHDVGSHDGPSRVWAERRHLLEGHGTCSTIAYGYKRLDEVPHRRQLL